MINLRELREGAKMTQEALAQETGVIRQTISNIECGISHPSVELAKRLARVLNVYWPDFFEYGDDDEK